MIVLGGSGGGDSIKPLNSEYVNQLGKLTYQGSTICAHGRMDAGLRKRGKCQIVESRQAMHLKWQEVALA
ncbi:MAG: hypothetical protein PHP05_08865 [Sideroxydans sp.]|nr:hypothetical protein [Sideroxydans sp.]